MTSASPVALSTGIARALRRRCPSCGSRGILTHWLRLADRCPSCGLRPNRGEADHFLGGYVINLGLAEALAALLWVLLLTATWPEPSWALMQWSAAVLVIGMPVAMYPITRLAFLAIDLNVQPRRPGDFGDGDPTFK
ncbi:MAG: DUF983 domain-containing protein [Gemmatimonadetes bacterium]|nr:DUF983 domain-containing protein [Gemmatimonadota bacterium]